MGSEDNDGYVDQEVVTVRNGLLQAVDKPGEHVSFETMDIEPFENCRPKLWETDEYVTMWYNTAFRLGQFVAASQIYCFQKLPVSVLL